MPPPPTLLVLGGLPGTGKTTLARILARRHTLFFLRIDTIEQALRTAPGAPYAIGPAGYIVAEELAASNLALGHAVLVDCVNPVPESRAAWRTVARRTGAILLEIELTCLDTAEHRRRVETRHTDIPHLALPTWQDVQARAYAPWPEPHLVINTATLTPEAAAALVERRLCPSSAPG